MKKQFVYVVFVAMLLLGNLQAETISFPATTAIPLTPADWLDQPLAFPKFDPSLGTLTKVQLDFGGNIARAVTVINNLETGFGIAGHAHTEFIVYGLEGLQLQSSFDIESGYFQGVIDPHSGAVYSDLIIPGLAEGEAWAEPNGGVIYGDHQALEDFSGSGEISFIASTSSHLVIDSDSSHGALFVEKYMNNSISMNGNVTYYYTAVPEPSSLILLGTSIIGFCFIRLFLYRWLPS